MSMATVCAPVLELLGQLPAQGEWEDVARRSLLHVQCTDCRNLSDHLMSSVPKQVEDKRLARELAGPRQMQIDEIPPFERSHSFKHGHHVS